MKSILGFGNMCGHGIRHGVPLTVILRLFAEGCDPVQNRNTNNNYERSDLASKSPRNDLRSRLHKSKHSQASSCSKMATAVKFAPVLIHVTAAPIRHRCVILRNCAFAARLPCSKWVMFRNGKRKSMVRYTLIQISYVVSGIATIL